MEGRATLVAECFWPGGTEADVEALDRRVTVMAADSARRRQRVRYLGSVLVREDEVVSCQFEGSEADVRALAGRAAVPYARVLETARTSS